MKCFVAKTGGKIFSGGWLDSMGWGITQVREDLSSVVKIYTVRAGEKHGRVFAEITKDGVRLIQNGRYMPLRRLRGTVHGKG